MLLDTQGCSAVAAAVNIAVHTEEDILAEDNLAADKTPLDIPQADNLNIKVVTKPKI